MRQYNCVNSLVPVLPGHIYNYLLLTTQQPLEGEALILSTGDRSDAASAAKNKRKSFKMGENCDFFIFVTLPYLQMYEIVFGIGIHTTNCHPMKLQYSRTYMYHQTLLSWCIHLHASLACSLNCTPHSLLPISNHCINDIGDRSFIIY